MRCYGMILSLVWLLSLGCAMSALAETGIPPISSDGILKLVKENKGKILFINFFATWCPPCREEIPDLVALRKEFSEKDVTLISVSLDSESKKLEKFVKEMEINYPVYRAEDDVAPAFTITSIPHNVVFSPEGDLIANEPGMVRGEDLRVFFNELIKMKKD